MCHEQRQPMFELSMSHKYVSFSLCYSWMTRAKIWIIHYVQAKHMHDYLCKPKHTVVGRVFSSIFSQKLFFFLDSFGEISMKPDSMSFDVA